jgi:uncharacterized protein (TIGR03790 family)
MLRPILLATLGLLAGAVSAETLTADRLGVVYNLNDAGSVRSAKYYAAERKVPFQNLVGLRIPVLNTISRTELAALRSTLIAALPGDVQSLVLVWSRPFAVECMSITTAVAAGYRAGFCEPGCGRTDPSPLYDAKGWLPADTAGWLPSMLLPSDDEHLLHALVARGLKADASHPPGTAFLVHTTDGTRDVRSAGYRDVITLVGRRTDVEELLAPPVAPVGDIIAYFTGAVRVAELPLLHFRPGAVADHLTSTGGVLDGSSGQMSALEWLKQGATGSYGTVSEPCNNTGKFPSPEVFLDHYLRGETLLEAYWKSVIMPGQGLFIGEPLARPYELEP